MVEIERILAGVALCSLTLLDLTIDLHCGFPMLGNSVYKGPFSIKPVELIVVVN